jgi:CHASE3 domain sensor protein
MTRNWTFGQKLGAGFALTVALTVAIGAVAVFALSRTVESKDQVITLHTQLLLDAERLRTARESKSADARAFLLTREERFLEEMRSARRDFTALVAGLKGRVPSEEGVRLLDGLAQAEAAHQAAVDQVIALRRTNASVEAVSRAFDEQVGPLRETLESGIKAFVSREERLLEEAQQASTATASGAVRLVLGIAVAVVVSAALVAFVLTRTLSRQIGSAVGRVQSSSAELQSAASQQATGAKEQATAMGEITTTISELLATSRQIADSARRVAQIAG